MYLKNAWIGAPDAVPRALDKFSLVFLRFPRLVRDFHWYSPLEKH
jgi:hypothetical protein